MPRWRKWIGRAILLGLVGTAIYIVIDLIIRGEWWIIPFLIIGYGFLIYIAEILYGLYRLCAVIFFFVMIIKHQMIYFWIFLFCLIGMIASCLLILVKVLLGLSGWTPNLGSERPSKATKLVADKTWLGGYIIRDKWGRRITELQKNTLCEGYTIKGSWGRNEGSARKALLGNDMIIRDARGKKTGRITENIIGDGMTLRNAKWKKIGSIRKGIINDYVISIKDGISDED